MALAFFLSPWIGIALVAALLIVTATVIMRTVRDHYSRQLELSPSPEEIRIRQLAETGAITAAEAETLRNQCRALPEVAELAPVPDLPLRLTAALSRACGLLWLITTVSAMGLLLVVAIGKEVAPECFTFHIKNRYGLLSPGGLVLLGCLLGLTLAPRKVLAGSRRAATVLVLSWCGLLAILFFTLKSSSPIEWAIGGPFVGCGIYALWTLLYRPGAARKFNSRSAEVRMGWKIALIPAVVLIAFGIERLEAIPALKTYITRGEWVSGRAKVGVMPASMRLEKLYLVADAPDQAALEVAKALADRLNRRFAIPCEVVAGTTPPALAPNREAALLIRGSLLPHSPTRQYRFEIRLLAASGSASAKPGLHFSGSYRTFNDSDATFKETARRIYGEMFPLLESSTAVPEKTE